MMTPDTLKKVFLFGSLLTVITTATACATLYTGPQLCNNHIPLPDAVRIKEGQAEIEPAIEVYGSVSTTRIFPVSFENSFSGYNDVQINAGTAARHGVQIADNAFLNISVAASGFFALVDNDTEESTVRYSGSSWGGTLQAEGGITCLFSKKPLRMNIGPSFLFSFDSGGWYDKRRKIATEWIFYNFTGEKGLVINASPQGYQSGQGFHLTFFFSPEDNLEFSLGSRLLAITFNPLYNASSEETATLASAHISVEKKRFRIWLQYSESFGGMVNAGNSNKRTLGSGLSFRLR